MTVTTKQFQALKAITNHQEALETLWQLHETECQEKDLRRQERRQQRQQRSDTTTKQRNNDRSLSEGLERSDTTTKQRNNEKHTPQKDDKATEKENHSPHTPLIKEKEKEKEEKNIQREALVLTHKQQNIGFPGKPRDFKEFRDYIVEQKLRHIDIRKFWACYTANDWTKRTGQPIQNWKAFVVFCNDNNAARDAIGGGKNNRARMERYPEDFRHALVDAKANNPWFFHVIPLEKAWANWQDHGTVYNRPKR